MEQARPLVAAHLTERILHSALQVHQALGPGLLESTYRTCLLRAMERDGLPVRGEVAIPIEFQGAVIQSAYRADIVVDAQVIVELKSVERLLPIHEAQILTYMKLANVRIGLLLNFNVRRLQHGIRRYIR
ncbi:MAG TPA: GxxExxY protein [Usitatibacter sp.]|nr:GxxExxY protein [Usitatibacter sp.]